MYYRHQTFCENKSQGQYSHMYYRHQFFRKNKSQDNYVIYSHVHYRLQLFRETVTYPETYSQKTVGDDNARILTIFLVKIIHSKLPCCHILSKIVMMIMNVRKSHSCPVNYSHLKFGDDNDNKRENFTGYLITIEKHAFKSNKKRRRSSVGCSQEDGWMPEEKP